MTLEGDILALVLVITRVVDSSRWTLGPVLVVALAFDTSRRDTRSDANGSPSV